MMRVWCQFFEMDVPVCDLTHGVSPCASTAETPCFNTIATCTSRATFERTFVTLRFAVATEGLPRDIDCIPTIERIDFTPGRISAGENVGMRSRLEVVLKDRPHSDTGAGFDPYWRERGRDPYNVGTLFGKLRARQPYLQRVKCRWVQGWSDVAPEDRAEAWETRHFYVDGFRGPDRGHYTVTAKDIMSWLDDDGVVYPRPSSGQLSAAITNSQLTAVLSPSGVGNAEYPSSGLLRVGDEIMEYTRSGNNLTVVRARRNTVAVAHEAGETVQVIRSWSQERPSDIIADVLAEAGIPSEVVDRAAWNSEDDAHRANRLYTGDLVSPRPVKAIVNSLIEQAVLSIFWDSLAGQLRYQAVREVPVEAVRIDPDIFDRGSLTVEEQKNKRLTEVFVHYGLRNPALPRNDFTSYTTVAVPFSQAAIEDHGAPSGREIWADWIAPLQQNTAYAVGAYLMQRFRDPPRRFTFTVFRTDRLQIAEGGSYLFSAQGLQAPGGELVDVPITVTRLHPGPDRYRVEAEELRFFPLDLADVGDPDPPPPPDTPAERAITISASGNTPLNLRTLYNQSEWAGDFSGASLSGRMPVRFIIVGARGSSGTGTPAIRTGAWPYQGAASEETRLVDLIIEIRGTVQGRGGNGGRGRSISPSQSPGSGDAGGRALQLEYPCHIVYGDGGRVWGGGGGGGGVNVFGGWNAAKGGGGGGGAGRPAGSGGSGPGNASNGSSGSATSGGNGGNSWTKFNTWEWEASYSTVRGGRGGGPGQAGQDGDGQDNSANPAPGQGASGGSAGHSIRGTSFILSTSGSGDVRGPTTVNP